MDSPTVESITQDLLASFDPHNVGKDDLHRFSSAPIIQFFLHRYRATGDAGCRQAVEQSLDKLSGSQVWSPSSENTRGENLSTISAMLELFAWAYLVLNREAYLEAAGRIADCMQLELSKEDDPAAPDSGLSMARISAASSLLDAAWLLNRPEFSVSGLAILDGLLNRISDGTLQDNNTASENSEDEAPIETYALSMDALAKAYGQTGQPRYQAAARQLGDRMISRYRSAEKELHPDGKMSSNRSAGTTSLFALGLARLFNHTFIPEYQRVALDALEQLGLVDSQVSTTAAIYALALDLLLHPSVEVTVVGVSGASGTKQLLRSASTIPYPNVDIKFIDSGDEERMEDAGYWGGDDAQAYVCMNTLCLAPASDPEALHNTVSDFLEPADPMAGGTIQSLGDTILRRRSSRT